MKKIVLILVLSISASFAWAQITISAHVEECRQDLNFSSSVFQSAFAKAQAMDYIQQALSSVDQELQDPFYCFTAVQLDTSPAFYIQLNVRTKFSFPTRYSFRFLVQASDEATSWIAIPNAPADAVVDNLIRTADFESVTAPTIGLSVFQAAMQSHTWQDCVSKIDPNSLSLFHLVTKGQSILQGSSYLVSWMSTEGSKAVLMTQKSTGEWQMVENFDMQDNFLNPMQRILQTAVPITNSTDQWTANLLRISLY